jgi:hypothetical protein
MRAGRWKPIAGFVAVAAVSGGLVAALVGLLVSIFERKQEARNPLRPPRRGRRR